jgi:hypothetical protein
MRARVGRRLRRALGVGLVAALAVGATACSDADDSAASGETVEIGVGSDEAAPAEELAEETSATEPAWARAVPAVGASTLSADLAADLSAVGLAAPRASREGRRGAVESADYKGTMVIEIAYYNYCQGGGDLEFAGTREYEMDAEVFVNPPAEDGGVEERSPFNLIIGAEPGVEGTLSVVSATVARNNRTGETVLLDYWDIDQRGDDIDGEMTERGPISVLNSISTADLFWPCRPDMGSMILPEEIAAGATLTGTVSDDSIELKLIGQSFSREVRFRATIEVDLED